jgi:cell division protein FtsI (penicillin-binding protein 3)
MVKLRTIRNRGRGIVFLLAFIGAVFIARAVHIQIIEHQKYAAYADSQQQSAMPLKAKRGAIYDCEGRALAYDIEAKTYTINPGYMNAPLEAAGKLAKLTGKSVSHWKQQFKKHPGYLVVASRVSPKKESEFENAGLETLRFRIESMRIYPYGDLASEVIGRTDTDNIGVSGLEMYYEDILSGIDGSSIYLRDARGREVTAWEHTIVQPQDGADIHLTLDVDLQQIVEEELEKMLDSSGSIYGSAVFLDVETGGVLACATVESTKPQFARCRSIVDMNEPGSTAKIIPLVTVFQAGLFEPDDVIDVEGGRFRVGRRVIRDDHPYDSLRCDEIGIYSSNIGVSKLGIAAGAERIYRTLVQLGFGARTGVDFPGESSGTIQKPDGWSDHLLASICFGYGIAATGIQIVSAYGAIASGGELHKPYFAAKMVRPDGTERTLNSKTIVRRVSDRRTARMLDHILRGAVEIGTARKARDDLYLIAGKTGTALRTRKEGRGYDPGRSLASFVGYFPAGNPRVVGLVMFDEPQTSIYGGEVSAPVLRDIVKRYSSLPRKSMLADARNQKPAYETHLSSAGGQGAQIMTLAATRATGGEVFPYDEVGDIVLPDFRGRTIRDAIRLARSLGLDYTIAGSGVVVSQSPAPGATFSNIGTLELVGGMR